MVGKEVRSYKYKGKWKRIEFEEPIEKTTTNIKVESLQTSYKRL